MICYFASEKADIKGIIPLSSIGKTKNQHCHETIKEALIYMVNPSIINAKRADINEIIELTNGNISCYLYRCAVEIGENFSYTKSETAKIISKEYIANIREFLQELEENE